MELKTIRHEVDGHVATVALHPPHRHNAWTGRLSPPRSTGRMSPRCRIDAHPLLTSASPARVPILPRNVRADSVHCDGGRTAAHLAPFGGARHRVGGCCDNPCHRRRYARRHRRALPHLHGLRTRTGRGGDHRPHSRRLARGALAPLGERRRRTRLDRHPMTPLVARTPTTRMTRITRITRSTMSPALRLRPRSITPHTPTPSTLRCLPTPAPGRVLGTRAPRSTSPVSTG